MLHYVSILFLNEQLSLKSVFVVNIKSLIFWLFSLALVAAIQKSTCLLILLQMES
jgi:hypothetical protein